PSLLEMSDPNQAKKILDVGCGWNKMPGAIGIDANPKTHADVIHNLGDVPYPFADDEFDEIICRHVIEHVPDVIAFVGELHRITRKFWEFYLSNVVRGKEIHFDFEVLKSSPN